jgi:hypothetical protein
MRRRLWSLVQKDSFTTEDLMKLTLLQMELSAYLATTEISSEDKEFTNFKMFLNKVSRKVWKLLPEEPGVTP